MTADARTPPKEDHYQILELSPLATDADVRGSFERLAILNHPDMNPLCPKATARFIRLEAARSTLLDADKRKAYDATYFPPTSGTALPYPNGNASHAHDFAAEEARSNARVKQWMKELSEAREQSRLLTELIFRADLALERARNAERLT